MTHCYLYNDGVLGLFLPFSGRDCRASNDIVLTLEMNQYVSISTCLLDRYVKTIVKTDDSVRY